MASKLALALCVAATSTAFGQPQVFSDLDRCLADPKGAIAVFAERFPHEACMPLSACDPKLVTSAEVIATRNCRQAAIQSCIEDDCADALTDRWDQIAASNNAALSAMVAELDFNALPRLTANRIAKYDPTAISCPNDPEVVQSVLGNTVADPLACDLYVSLTKLEAAEAMGRILSSIDTK